MSELCNRLRDTFVESLPHEGPELDAFLDRSCAGDPDIRRQVVRLRQLRDRVGNFLETPALELLDAASLRTLKADPIGEPLARGTVFGDFTIEQTIGAGGHGTVYRARQRSVDDRVVALKVCHAPPRDQRWLERFRREVSLAGTIQHPNLVPVYASGYDEGRGAAWMASRLVEGPNLQDVLDDLERGELVQSAGVRKNIVARCLDVANALTALHERGLVHRDVKPANIVLEGGSTATPLELPALLVDFGLATRIGDGRRSTVRATPEYASAEQLLGKELDARSDVYSLGVVLFDLLTSRGPDDRRRGADEKLEPLRRLVPEVDRDLETIVARATAPWPRDRHGDASELAGDLSDWLHGKFRRRRHRRRITTITRVSIATLAILIVSWLGIDESRAALRAEHFWKQGDLEKALDEVKTLPLWLFEGVVIPHRLCEMYEASKSANAASPVAQVARALIMNRRADALLSATTHLEGAGLAADPDLERFLLFQYGRGDETARSLVARLFLDAPNASPEEVRESTKFRSVLVEDLQHETSPAALGHVFVALGGCGTLDEVERISKKIRTCDELLRSPDTVNVGLHAIIRILSRMRACGWTDATARHTVQSFPTILCDLLRELKNHELLPLTSEDAVVRALGLSRRVMGLDPGSLEPFRQIFDPTLRTVAAFRDPALRQLLTARELKPLQRKIEYSYYQAFEEFGYVVGCYEDTTVDSIPEADIRSRVGELEAKLKDSAKPDAQLDPDHCVELFSRGFAQARRDLAGASDSFLFDEDTHLGAVLHTLTSDPIPLLEQPPSPHREIGRLTMGEPELGGMAKPPRPKGQVQGMTVSTTYVQAPSDPYIPRSHYARLAAVGHSEIRLDFENPRTNLRLAIDAQKSRRDALPGGGRCRIDLLLDGKSIGTHDLSAEKLEYDILIAEGITPGPHQVTVRLNRFSSTPLFVYRLTLRRF